MKLNQTKSDLVQALESGNKLLKDVRMQKLIEEVEKLDLPDLENGYEYNTIGYNKVIKQRVFWNQSLNCWDFDNEETVANLNI